MKAFIKNYWKTLVFFAVVGLVGGFFVGIYLLDSYPAEIQQQLLDELDASGLGMLPADIFWVWSLRRSQPDTACF